MKFTGNLVDLHQREIYPASITVVDGRISNIEKLSEVSPETGFVMPGFVDAHVHIESSMLPPSEFARMAVVHGTVGTVSDPHEIANVLGKEGVLFMLGDAQRVPFKFCFGAPSCVPATAFETAGAQIDTLTVSELLAMSAIGYLSEMMNFPGVLHQDPEILAKIAAAQQLGKPIDGHAPGLRGAAAQAYFSAGISTDHECFTYQEGEEKAALGVKILIREGSAARNFEALYPLLKKYPDQIMFCSDDKHPDELQRGHINQLAARAIALGCDLFDTLRAACLHPVEHYKMGIGLLRVGDPADFIVVEDLSSFKVTATYIDGKLVAENGQTRLPKIETTTPNNFLAIPFQPIDFQVHIHKNATAVKVIRVLEGQIVTAVETEKVAANSASHSLPNISTDCLLIAVVNRYANNVPPALGFVRGFGLQCGALASSVAHDSHNIVAVGTDSVAICAAVNAVIESKGGISATDGNGDTRLLPLPIAGLMSNLDGYNLALAYSEIDFFTKNSLGCTLKAPFMSLSFLALPVIPALKMTDLGLFDTEKFGFTEVEIFEEPTRV